MSDEVVRTRREGAVLEVELDRPKANAIDAATSRRMGEVFAGFRDDPELKVAILSTAGAKFFSAGWDLKAAAEGELRPDDDYGPGGFGGLQELPDLGKPVIGAVTGMAAGGGFELALSCDMIVAGAGASFALPEIRSGTVADAATIRLPARLPYHIAVEMLFTGRWMAADEAARWGLVNRRVADADVRGTAREMAAGLAGGPPLVFAAIKEVLRERETQGFGELLARVNARDLPSIDRLYSSEDQLEGARAFAEKREPVWKGR